MVNGGSVICVIFGALVRRYAKGKGDGGGGGGGKDDGTMYITGRFLDDYITNM
jgi:hypothetical protein